MAACLRTRTGVSLCTWIFAASLAACGGGGGDGEGGSADPATVTSANEITPGDFQVNPGASWRPRSPGDYFSGTLSSVDLTRLNGGKPLGGGRILDVQSLGSFHYDIQGHLAYVATGLFVDAQGQPLAPATGSGVRSVSSSQECGLSSGGDSVPEDFAFSATLAQPLVVPEGAAALRLSVSDCYFRDNALSDDPIRIRIILRPSTTSSAA